MMGRRDNEGSESSGRGETAYPKHLVTSTVQLLQMQYRAWQRDLRDPEQPLLEYGFHVMSDPEGIDGRSCRYDAFDGVSTILLGESIVHGRSEGHAIAVDRQTLRISTAYLHERSPVARVVAGAPEASLDLMPKLTSWIGGYEQWVCDCWGEEQRARLLEGLGVDGDFPSRWWKLAMQWRRTLATT